MTVFLIGMAFGAILSWAIGAVIVCLFIDDDDPIIYPPY